HTRRWYPEFVQARRLLRAGVIGPLRSITATLAGPRAMLFRNGTHLVDTICFFAESDPAWLVGDLDDEHRAYGPRYAGDGGRDAATDPGGSAYIHFANGVRAFVNASKRTMGNFELDLVGESGRLRVGADVAEIWRPGDSGTAISRISAPQTTKGDMVAAIEEIIGMIEDGRPGTSTGADGRRTLSILLGILQSSAAGGKRIDFPIVDV
ncbi:MAG: Gfo/Idh/MocA family protein, partial [Chloroflexota bacterium]